LYALLSRISSLWKLHEQASERGQHLLYFKRVNVESNCEFFPFHYDQVKVI